MKGIWNSKCIKCLSDKYLTDYPDIATEEERLEYMRGILKILREAKSDEPSPLAADRMVRFQTKMFGEMVDYREIKHFFNDLMLHMEPAIEERIQKSGNPVYKAMQYVMIGNYIDFGVLSDVSDAQLMELIAKADDQEVDAKIFAELCKELEHAETMVFLTDNCGEIVFDKLLIRAIQTVYPNVTIDVIVRGELSVNDATMEDAVQVGLTELVKVIGNGNGVPGTYLPLLSGEARALMEQADLIVSKGQGNFETLCGCGLNIYYLFLCKCERFTERFEKKLFEGILTKEKYCGEEGL